jgi:hypothetical protein
MWDDEIARHALDKGHWPGRTAEQVKAIIAEVRSSAQDSYDFGNGRRMFRKGNVILLEDGKGGGMLFRPSSSALRYFIRKMKEDLG